MQNESNLTSVRAIALNAGEPPALPAIRFALEPQRYLFLSLKESRNLLLPS